MTSPCFLNQFVWGLQPELARSVKACIILKASHKWCLWQKPPSWLSKHPDAQQVTNHKLVGPYIIKIGGEANGEDVAEEDFAVAVP